MRNRRSVDWTIEEDGVMASVPLQQGRCLRTPSGRGSLPPSSLPVREPEASRPTPAAVCFKCRGVLQVALAAMEAHQRTSALSGSSWAETVAAERVQRQELR